MENSLPFGTPPTTKFSTITRREAVLLDSNLLLLLIVGLSNPRLIAIHKRVDRFTSADFILLQLFVGSFQRILTTPHVLTEVSNLVGSSSGKMRDTIMLQLSSVILTLEEHTPSAIELCRSKEARIFGLTDAALTRVASQALLLTEDGRLARHLASLGITALTLHDLRALQTKTY